MTQPNKPNPWAWKPWQWEDAAQPWAVSRAAERAYERQLLSVARQIQAILIGNPQGQITDLLRKYADIITPWAIQSASNMLQQADKKNLQAWQSLSRRMGLDMRVFLASPGLGQAVRTSIDNNVRLIRSLVIESADKVSGLIQEGLVTGIRADDLAKQIAHVGEVSESRARVIARTETSKAQVALTQARATSVGSTGYIWRTARDGATRPSHRAMEGKFVAWDEPVSLDGMTGHAGEFPNCRCYPEPVIPRKSGGYYGSHLPTQEQEAASGVQAALSQWEKRGGQLTRHVPGQPLPNHDQAVIQPAKINGYLLNPDHASGRNKARQFRAALGYTNSPEHQAMFEANLRSHLAEVEAVYQPQPGNVHGDRFVVLAPLGGPNGRSVAVKSVWAYDRGQAGGQSTRPRLITAYLDDKDG